MSSSQTRLRPISFNWLNISFTLFIALLNLCPQLFIFLKDVTCAEMSITSGKTVPKEEKQNEEKFKKKSKTANEEDDQKKCQTMFSKKVCKKYIFQKLYLIPFSSK